MARVLAIDYGRKRTGAAVTDALRLSVNPLPVIATPDLHAWLRAYLSDHDVDTLVLTRSERADGRANPVQGDIDALAAFSRKLAPALTVAFQDETSSSREARAHLIATGVGRKRRSAKGALDPVAAGIILERYLRDAGIW